MRALLAESLKKQLFPKKEALYSEFITIFFKILYSTDLKNNKKQDSSLEKNVAKIRDLNKNILLIASNDVILEYSKFMKLAYNKANPNPTKQIEEFCNLIIAMRKEFGHKKYMEWKTIARIWITDIDEYCKKLAQGTAGGLE